MLSVQKSVRLRDDLYKYVIDYAKNGTFNKNLNDILDIYIYTEARKNREIERLSVEINCMKDELRKCQTLLIRMKSIEKSVFLAEKELISLIDKLSDI